MPKDHFARVRKLGLALPGVELGTSYGTPALKVRKRLLVRMKEDGETLVLLTGDLDEKELLMTTHPGIFFETDHYKGWPAVLVRLKEISDELLGALLEESWRREAPKKLVATFSAKDPGTRSRRTTSRPRTASS
jgi:hypothetical protein